MPVPDEEPDNLPLLLEAIKNQPIHRLEGILQDIVKHSPEGRKIASKWLLAAKNDVKSEPAAKEESIASVPMTSRFENCIYCLEDFKVTQNSETSCKYHLESDVVDEEYFKAEIAAGYDVDSDEYRLAWPEGFFYPCCGMGLTGKMCQVGWHKAADPDDRPRKRTRRSEF
ncbi:hypothetical protein PENSOL_c021G12091 [Penicillium solitum]|uniref:Uncharacterized protein n=1 Tax=Penicillium solitum TaxID=60172 RepID=A0A1V6R1D1_9EURO|nr:uncharacterized protein PENSOL_c021G12091 [Penicillium solitum]OQD95229.1 hypothetical protein PENSOL_c021G12091 [Penicillium solitum]